MDIKFCSLTNESIPDGEFEAGRAITVGKKSYYVSAAIQRLLSRGRLRGWLAFGLGLYAAGVTTFLLVRELGRKPVDPNVVQPAVLAAVDERVDARNTALQQALTKATAGELKTLSDQIAERLRAVETTLASEQRALGTLTEEVNRRGEALTTRFASMDRRQARMEEDQSELRSWILKIQTTAEDLTRRIADARAEAAKAAAATPAPAEPAPEAPVAPDAGTPTVDEEHDRKVTQNIEYLKSRDDNVVFTATVQLGELGDLRAAKPLAKVLEDHKDFYARLGAATALGQLKAVDGFDALVEALADKDDLVRTQSNDSLIEITGESIEFASEMSRSERQKVQRRWRNWFKENEAALRQRLGQELTPGTTNR